MLNVSSLKENSFNLTASKNNTAPLYAKEGEPMYIKDMDIDDDGKITLDEFNQYCDENGISAEQRVQMLELRNVWKTQKALQEKTNDSKNDNKLEEKKLIYARKGDFKYDEAMDYNDDEKVTYEEYLKYCEKHSSKKENANSKTETKNPYNTKDCEQEPEIRVESEA